ncbi:MAG: hypothetical protein DCF17_02240 [Shackletoniella antarctica]|uniref:Uncharacterized protein n=1 Tax=Shackletoniella antarctica TaxID=268115 RepID=A0A2W4WLC8_9CYAN|nr:MAG: hypothetical protein DCF17_02240 [Shackletoniella antarctica]
MTVGTIESLWRYPVKSMGGETLTEAFMGFSGFGLVSHRWLWGVPLV